MSRDDDFFDDDLFGDDNNQDDFGGDFDDDFGFVGEDEMFDETDDVDDFDFDNELGEVDEDFDGFGDIRDDDFAFDEDDERSGPNRTFILLALIMIILFLVGIGLVVFLATQEDGPSEFELESTRIAQANATDIAGATLTADARNAISTETQEAVFAGQTATAEAELTAIPLTETAQAQLTAEQGTAIALTEIALSVTPTPVGGGLDLPGTQTAQAQNLTATAIAQQTEIALLTLEAEGPGDEIEPTEAPDDPPAAISADDVAATATAIAERLRGGDASPTPVEAVPGGEVDPPDVGGTGDELPRTGLLDDLSSEQGILTAMLMAFGLLSVIVVSRTLRNANVRNV
jgi:hypothetical protein